MFSKQNGWERWEEAVYKAIPAGTPHPYYIYIYITMAPAMQAIEQKGNLSD